MAWTKDKQRVWIRAVLAVYVSVALGVFLYSKWEGRYANIRFGGVDLEITVALIFGTIAALFAAAIARVYLHLKR